MAQNTLPTGIIIQGLDKNVPKWATEGTLREIQTEIIKAVHIMQQKAKLEGLNTKGSQTEIDDFEKKLSELNNEQKTNTAQLKKYRTSFGDTVNETTDSLERMRSATKSGYTGITALSGITDGVTGVFKNILSPVGLFGSSIAVAGFALGEFVGYLKNTSQALIGLYDNGLTFQNSIGDLRLAAATAVMPLDEFAKLLVKNSAVVKSFGKNGAQQFANLTQQTRDLIKSQGYYGLRINEVNEYTGDYLELLRKQGVLIRLNDYEQSQSSANYIKQLTSFSQILGKSRDQINKDIQHGLKDPRILALVNSLGPLGTQFSEKMTALLGTISGLGGEDAQATLNDFITAIGSSEGSLTNFNKGLLAAGRGDLSEQFINVSNSLKDGSISLEQAQIQYKKLFQEIGNFGPNEFTNLKTNMQSINSPLHDAAAEMTKFAAASKGADFAKINSNFVEEPDNFTKSVVALRNTLDEIRAQISAVFAKFIQDHQTFLNDIIKNLASAAEWILDTIKNLIDPKTRKETIDSITGSIETMIEKIFTNISNYIEQKLGLAGRVAKGTYQAVAGLPSYLEGLATGSTVPNSNPASNIPILGVGESVPAPPRNNNSTANALTVARLGYIPDNTSYAKPNNTTTTIANLPLLDNNTAKEITNPTSEQLDTIADLHKQAVDHAANLNKTLLKTNQLLGDIKQNVNSDPNVIK